MVSMAESFFHTPASKFSRYRTAIQGLFLVAWLGPLGLRVHTVCAPVFHCYACPLASFACPIGILAQFSALHVMPFLAIGILVVTGALVGSFVCGWACPFGLLQDLAARVPLPKWDPPYWLTHMRYAALVGLVIILPWFFGESHPLFFCRVCPAGALEGSVPMMVTQAAAGQAVAWPNAMKLGVTGAVVLAMFFVRRPWCQILCPLGAIFGLFNRISLFAIRFYPARCVDCGKCGAKCDFGVSSRIRADDPRCIRCMECVHCGACQIEAAWQAKPSALAADLGVEGVRER